jgi:hypothetical protein
LECLPRWKPFGASSLTHTDLQIRVPNLAARDGIDRAADASSLVPHV